MLPPEFNTGKARMQFEPLSVDTIETSGLAPFIDHTLLRPDARIEEIERLCAEARRFEFAGVCVHSLYLPLVSDRLRGSKVKTVSVIGFPHGANLALTLAREAGIAVKAGAEELDMVIPIGLLKSGELSGVRESVRAAVGESQGKPVKVIIETALLTDDEKKTACEISAHAGARWVKTCTGFAGGGATVADVRLMKAVVGNDLGVKASGGIKSAATARDLLLAGAHRLGTSSGVALVTATAAGPGY